MREVIFRGQKVDTKEWVYGNLIIAGSECYILQQTEDAILKRVGIYGHWYINKWCANVITETVGQFTGLTDKNGVKIFEGDVVKWTNGNHYWEAIISTVPKYKSNTLYAVETFHNCTIDEEKDIYTYERSDSRRGVRNEIEYLSKDTSVIGNIHDKHVL